MTAATMVSSAAVRSRHAHRAAALEQRADAILLGQKPLREVRKFSGKPFGQDGLAWLESRPAEDLQISVDARRSGLVLRRFQARHVLLIVGRSLRKHRHHGGPLADRQMGTGKKIRLDCLHRIGGIETERAGQLGDRRFDAAGPIDPTHDLITLADRIAHDFGKRDIRRGRDGGRERTPERAVCRTGSVHQNGEAQLVDQLRLGAFLQHREACRDIGLERKLMQQPRAERVDGQHLEAARRIQRFGEQAPRMRAAVGVGLSAVDFLDLRVERRVVEAGPPGKRVEHAARHVGGGRLGEGEAQRMRLGALPSSRSRITRCASTWVLPDPALAATQAETAGSDASVCTGSHFERNGRASVTAHSSSVSSSPPFADHSLTRARWS